MAGVEITFGGVVEDDEAIAVVSTTVKTEAGVAEVVVEAMDEVRVAVSDNSSNLPSEAEGDKALKGAAVVALGVPAMETDLPLGPKGIGFWEADEPPPLGGSSAKWPFVDFPVAWEEATEEDLEEARDGEPLGLGGPEDDMVAVLAFT